jgi:hypothetical protein
MSCAKLRARVKVSPETERKVARIEAASCTPSAVARVERSIPSANAAISSAVSPEAYPVALSTASSRRYD